jgi:hypothetical protein
MKMNKEHIIEAVGQEYTKWFYDNAVSSVSGKPILNGEGILTRGEFINKCKTDPEFSERWGLKIEERELYIEERAKLLSIRIGHEIKETSLHGEGQFETEVTQDANAFNISTKLITITYNNETIESYE